MPALPFNDKCKLRWVWLFHDYVYDYGKCRWLGAQYTIIAKWRQLGGASITSACHPVSPPSTIRPPPPPSIHIQPVHLGSTGAPPGAKSHPFVRKKKSGGKRRSPRPWRRRRRRRLIAVHAKNIVNHSLTVCYLLNKANDLMA